MNTVVSIHWPRRLVRALAVCALAALGVAGPTHAARVIQTRGRVVLENGQIRRTLATDGTLHTLSFERLPRGSRLAVESEEFLLRDFEGRQWNTQDFRLVRPPLVRHGSVASVECVLEHVGAPHIRVSLYYTLADGQFFTRKWLKVESEVPIDRAEVERFRAREPMALGGFGQPLWIEGKEEPNTGRRVGGWFAGLEYPGGYQEHKEGLVCLAHFPGQRAFTSKKAVIGADVDGNLEDSFERYLGTIRRPPRSFLQYNSWYDLRREELTCANLAQVFHAFRQHLLEPYGLRMDAFVPDDGWQNPDSIWETNPTFLPEGFRPLAKELEQYGSRLGLWMPFNGTHLNVEWGRAQGLEVASGGRYYCLAAPRYRKAIEEAIARRIADGNLAYFKHDFNHLRCRAEGHNHPPTDAHGFEANLDAELELLAKEREWQPGIFLNVTSGMWLSPWWLMHADSIWMGAADFGFEREFPQWSPREWEMSYRDAYLYRKYCVDRVQYPLSSLMTHGIIHGRRNRLGGPDETLEEFSDSVVMYFGRGVLLKELYITPSLMDADRWDVLGRAARWATEMANDMVHTRFLGGDPAKGQAYGYVHWGPRRGIFVLRNPGFAEATLSLSLAERPRYPRVTVARWRFSVIYPYREHLPQRMGKGTPLSVRLPGCSVMVLEALPDGPLPSGEPKTGRFAIEKAGEMGQARLVAYVPEGEEAPIRILASGVGPGEKEHLVSIALELPAKRAVRCDLFWILHGPAGRPVLTDFRANGTPVRAARHEAEKWAMYRLDLSECVGRTVVTATLPAMPPSTRAGDLALEAWVVRERSLRSRPLGAVRGPLRWLPRPLHPDRERHTVPVMARVPLG